MHATATDRNLESPCTESGQTRSRVSLNSRSRKITFLSTTNEHVDIRFSALSYANSQRIGLTSSSRDIEPSRKQSVFGVDLLEIRLYHLTLLS